MALVLVNGTDRDDDLAGYDVTFETALRAAGYIGQRPKTLTIPEAKPRPDPVPAPELARGWLSRILSRLIS